MSDFQAVQDGINALQSKLSAEIKSGLSAQDAKLEAAITELAQGGVGIKATSGTADNLGSQVATKFEENRELFEKTRSVRLEVKAAGDAITTASGRNIITGGVGAITGGVLGLQNALPSRRTPSTSAVEYSRFTGTQGAAAVQAGEGTAKAAVRPDHSLIVQSAITIAGYSKMSRQALNDSEELKRCVNVTLLRSTATALDAALVSGVVAPAFDGYGTLATATTSLVYTALVDAISESVSAMQVAGFAPDAVALNPADWLAVTVAKGSDLHYLSGAYLGALPSEMRGLRVVLSPSVAAGKALLMDTAHAELLVVDGFSVEIAYSGDDFTKNLCTVLGELRVIPVFRTAGSMRLITPKA